MPPEADLPWAPLMSVNRSGVPELTTYGIAYAWAEDRALYANAGRSLLRVGDTRKPLWSRSLLKPWQFLVLYPTLKAAYPSLSDAHFAMMTASHQGDTRQAELLSELLTLGEFSEVDLQCPCTRPLKADNGRAEATALNHPCSGKHLAHLLYFKATGQDPANYMDAQAEPYQRLRMLLEFLLNRDVTEATVDGCGMPNYALSAVETAQLYHALVMPLPKSLLQQSPDELDASFAHWDEVSGLIRRHPKLIGGENRLDTRLMQGAWQARPDLAVIAKEGADGLLAVGIGPSEVFPDGLGLYLKLASGYHPAILEKLVFELLTRLGLKPAEPKDGPAHLETVYHFELQGASALS